MTKGKDRERKGLEIKTKKTEVQKVKRRTLWVRMCLSVRSRKVAAGSSLASDDPSLLSSPCNSFSTYFSTCMSPLLSNIRNWTYSCSLKVWISNPILQTFTTRLWFTIVDVHNSSVRKYIIAYNKNSFAQKTFWIKRHTSLELPTCCFQADSGY